MTIDTIRNATLGDLAEMLKSQQSRKLDVIAPATRLRAERGILVVEGTEAILNEDGVTSADGRYRPTAVFDEGVAAKLGVPVGYLKRIRAERSDLYDANVNGWLRGEANGDFQTYAPDPRSFLVRLFRPDDEGTEGIARAFLSDSYRMIDNLDVLMAALDGVRTAGVPVDVTSTDLTERRMHVKVQSPAVAELAPELLANYRSPFSGNSGSDNPTVFAGFVVSNSEVGGGAFTITPRLVVQVCSNGMTMTKDALRSIHLGAKQDDGVVRWSADTLQANLELVRNQAKDAVATFLDPDYLRAKIGQLTEGAREAATVKTVETVTKQLSYSAEQTESILDHFVKGGQATLGGVAQAITSVAQTIEDADVAADMEGHAASLLLG